MSRPAARDVVIAVGCLVALGLFAVQAVSLFRLSGVATGLGDTEAVFGQWVDSHVEAGYEEIPIRRDDPMLALRKIVVTTGINERTSKDVVSRLLVLSAMDPHKPIDLYVSTQGGWVDSAFAIIDTMQLIEAPVNTWAVGGCYSAGALIVAAGTGVRRASPNSLLMVHANLDAGDARFSVEPLVRERYENLLRTHASLPADWFPMVGDKSYYLSADEALEYHLVDEIYPPEKGDSPSEEEEPAGTSATTH